MIEQLHAMLAFAGPEAIREIFQLYVEDVPRRLTALRAALADEDADALRRAAHGLRGCSVSIGADVLAELCWEVEEGAADPKVGVDNILRESEWVVGLVSAEIARIDDETAVASTG